MPLELDAGSRFQFTQTVLLTLANGETVETFGAWKMPKFLKNRPNPENIGRYVVTSGREGRPDQIALEIYGSQYLDWIIVAFNNATDPLNWPKAGTVVEYPLPRVVFAEID